MATQDEILQLRRRVGDTAKTAVRTLEYAGTDAIDLGFHNLSNVVIVLNQQTLETDKFSVNGSLGIVTLDADVAQQNDTLTISFAHTAYTDEEIAVLIATYGERGAVVEIINELLADSAKMFDYSEGGTETKQSQIFKNLERLLRLYQNDDGTIKQDTSVPAGFAVLQRDFGEPARSYSERNISRSDC